MTNDAIEKAKRDPDYEQARRFCASPAIDLDAPKRPRTKEDLEIQARVSAQLHSMMPDVMAKIDAESEAQKRAAIRETMENAD